jgi:hypothetical protein
LEILETLGLFWFVLGDWSMNERETLLQKEKNLEIFETFLFVLGDWSMNVLQKKEKKNLEHLMHPWLGN